MPPKLPAAAAVATTAVAGPSTAPPPPASPSPPPDEEEVKAQDMLILQDLMDTLEQMPTEMTRVHADLNELGAVLYSGLQLLQGKLDQMMLWLQDPTIKPEQRFQLLQEIGEEAARYKLGGDDKIRVAAGACDALMSHQKHISNLLAASTLLQSAPPSPYTTALTLEAQPTVAMSRRQIARAQNSPFTGAGGRGNAEGRVGDTPTKKKKSRVQQLGRDDDETSSVGGGSRKVVKKKKPNARAPSPTDSINSTTFPKTDSYPRTARQVAAAQAAQQKARKADRDDESDESEPERLPEKKRSGPMGGAGIGGGGLGMQITASSDSNAFGAGGGGGGGAGGLGLDVGHSRDASSGTGHGTHAQGGRSAGATPLLAGARKRTTTGGSAGTKRPREDDESDDDQPLGAGRSLAPPATAGPGGPRGAARKTGPAGGQDDRDRERETDGEEVLEGGADVDNDGRIYCICKQLSFGEMIGCDDEDCEIEWYHVQCVGFTHPPAGDWTCDLCNERNAHNKSKSKKGGGGKAKAKR